jgi:TRAP-type C4-dicarboxylate transport system substrate-binding protein
VKARLRCRLLLLVALTYASAARANEPAKLRVATMAPEGSGWARAMHAFSEELATETAGAVQLHWYLGGMAGDEMTTIDRLKRGQLDGAALSQGCEKLAPSLRVLRVPGLTRSRDEVHFILGQLAPRVEKELRKNGLTGLALGEFGPILLFSRTPIRTFAELAPLKVWVWDRDDVWVQLLRSMGMTPVPLPVDQAGRAFDEHRIDGFTAVPAAALVFQWSTQARWFTDLSMGMLPACFVMSESAVDALPFEQQNTLRTTSARFGERFESEAARLDSALIGGLLERQGGHRVASDEALRETFYSAARQARDDGDAQGMVEPELLRKVLGWLADYRAEHYPTR